MSSLLFRPVLRKIFATVATLSLIFAPVAGKAAESVVPNDTFWGQQWYMRQVHAPEAWAVTTGSRDLIVAVIDTGVDITHEDLRSNIWTNSKEVPGNGVDDDNNGYVDDVHGWNYVTKTPDVRPVYLADQYDEAWSHGTLVASLLGAKGDNDIGIAGMVWNVKILPLVVLDGNGEGSVDDILSAIRYAVSQGASVINLSLTSYDEDPRLDELVRNVSAAGVVLVAATGNGEDLSGINIDTLPTYPACSDADDAKESVLGVSGTDTLDQRAPYANFGKRCTDISAPAQDLFGARPSYPRVGETTSTVSGYVGDMVGTSLAAPLVSGVAALLKSAHPSWTAAQIREQIERTADPIDGSASTLHGGALGFGRLNAGRALTELPAWAALAAKPVVAEPTNASVMVTGSIVTFQHGDTKTTLQPYGVSFRGTIQTVALPNGGWLLWPSAGGGHMLLVDADGKVRVNTFPFGKKASGKWTTVPGKSAGFVDVKTPSGAWRTLFLQGFTWEAV
jgi:subtilisin family serine protease